ncbi:MFS transporter [Kibdelosporangium aridum]|uniref:Major Facilitator Superfamily protein n=1 Tax=Kibdelosporangium aridum TaxID=2030 RepID=A0A1W2F8J4_KIBAR|nr:MFS transporter [Kibdelosporangium aridum]SMD18267.1 Major Facilitator Superfamily protein [Kibdelosporangium aridum]
MYPSVRDCFGRTYQVGPVPEELIGRSRAWMAWLPWAAMAATGVMQYAFGSLAPQLAERGWDVTETLWLLAAWTIFQAIAGFPTAYLRERGKLGPRAVMVLGAALMLAGMVSLAHFDSYPMALLGYSVLGGTGAGLVYATCTSTVAKWHPEQMASRVSFVTGAFAYGAVPFAIAFLFTPPTIALDVAAVIVAAVVATTGVFFRDPPPDWWPPHIDPQEWAVDRRRSPSRAVRQFSVREALRTGVLPVMYFVLLAASAVSLFTVTFFAILGAQMGIGLAVVAIGTAILLGANGAGRSLAIRISEQIGRRRAIGAVLVAQAVGQVILAGAASSGSIFLLLVAVTLAGVGGGAFYPLFASLAREFFGDRDIAKTHGVVYSAKAFGGVIGVGLAAFAVPAMGFPAVFLISGLIALASAILSVRLRRPGHVSTLPIMYVVDTTMSPSLGSGGSRP